MIETWPVFVALAAVQAMMFWLGRWTATWHPRAVRVVAHHLRLQPDDVVALEVQGPIDEATVELLRQEWARQRCPGKLVLVPAESRVIGHTPPPTPMPEPTIAPPPPPPPAPRCRNCGAARTNG